jgi:hydrogenase maturation protease
MRDAFPPLRGRAPLSGARFAVAVLGTPFRGDDAVGPRVGGVLRDAGVPVLDCGDEPTRLIEHLEGLDVAVVVDAVRTGAPPGTLHRVEVTDGPLPAELGLASTHAFGVGEAIELARALGRAPRRVVVVGVEGVAFGMGDPVTPQVEAALAGAVDEVLRTIGGA